MPAIIAWVVGGLAIVLRHLVGRIVVMLGIQAVIVTGVTTGLNALKSSFLSAYGGLPAAIVQIFGLLRVDQAALVIFAAIAARVALKAVSGSVTRFGMSAPPAGRL